MTNEVTHTLTLQEKVSERIKQQIGELIEPADLARLVAQAMQDAFFKERFVSMDGYDRKTTKPPLIVETVALLLKPAVDEQVKAWFVEHDADVAAMLKKRIEEGLAGAVLAVINAKLQGDFWTFGNQLSQRLLGRPL